LTIGVLNVLAATLMSVAIGTNKWAEASVVRNIAIPNGNLTRDASFTAGFKYIGMFRGCEEKKYGSYFEPRSRCFNALEEYGEIAKAELAYAALISCCLCICLQVIITYILLYDELVRSASKRMQCTIPTVTMSFIVFLGSTSFGSYVYLYRQYLQVSLLSKSDRQDGFSTQGSSSLGFSFWLMAVASLLNILSLLMIIVGNLKRGKETLSFGRRNINKSDVTLKQRDGPVMMMY